VARYMEYETPTLEVTRFGTADSVMTDFGETSQYESMTEIDNPAGGDWDDF
jgi:hypothetical protein